MRRLSAWRSHPSHRFYSCSITERPVNSQAVISGRGVSEDVLTWVILSETICVSWTTD